MRAAWDRGRDELEARFWRRHRELGSGGDRREQGNNSLLQEEDPSFDQFTASGDFNFGFKRSGILFHEPPQETSVSGPRSVEYLVLGRSGIKLSASSSGAV
ncbi:hypothetical protein KFK09_011715 [Dendrobium nobile]|uniref:Uncharacterized protein n=1 Tax=Dendrobium nobile TaxID=94219 RepID=A0A8T3BFA3_DENNO|nr:hypothetical protein KFK09_011715 [Dendrobium nobile]